MVFAPASVSLSWAMRGRRGGVPGRQPGGPCHLALGGGRIGREERRRPGSASPVWMFTPTFGRSPPATSHSYR